MKKLQSALRIVLFASIMLMLAALTQAQAPRTWVSGVGDDANPCARTTPCRTFAGAISKTATGGEIDLLDADAAGTVTITKSITIDGTGSMAGILANAGDAIKINITNAGDTAKAVRLRHLSINGMGTGTNGINIVAATDVTIEDCVVDGFTGNGISVATGAAFIRHTSIRHTANAVSVSAGATAGLADDSLVFNGTAIVGDASDFGNNVAFGNKKGNTKPK
jgi:hypothetical protein